MMKRILIEGGKTVITSEEAMKWYCWHQIVNAMEKDEKTLSLIAKKMNEPENRNIPNWEEKFLKLFLETTETDLIID